MELTKAFRDQYISDLKQSIVDLQNKLKQEQSLNNEIELQYQERIHELEQEQQVSCHSYRMNFRLQKENMLRI